jgi:type IV secretion system protein VirD4
VIHGRVLADVTALAHIGHPASAWGSPVGAAWTYWLCTFLVVTIGAALTLLGFTVLRHVATGHPRTSTTRGEGFAPRAEIERSAGSRALLRHCRTLRPILRHPRPAEVGYFLGTSRRVS